MPVQAARPRRSWFENVLRRAMLTGDVAMMKAVLPAVDRLMPVIQSH